MEFSESNATIFMYRQSRLTGIFLFFLLVIVYEGNAQTKVPCNEITGEMGFTVQTVHIAGRWVPDELQARVEQMIGLGKGYDPSNLNPALELVRDALVKSEHDFALRLVGSTSVLYIDAEVCDVSDSTNPKQAKVTIRAFYMRIDLYNIGKNMLPVPRSARPTFFKEVPSLLLATSPVVGVFNDRQYGPSVSIQTSTDLLTVSRIKNPDNANRVRLNADIDIRQSLNHPFHTVGVDLDLVKPVYSDTTVGWDIGLRYANYQQPLAKGKYQRELFRVSGAIQGSSKLLLLRKYSVGAGARFLQNRYNLAISNEIEHPESGYEFFALSDGHLLNGFTRIGIWFDAGVPKKTDTIAELKSYQRLAGRISYGYVLGKGYQNVDVEATLGAGHAWGSPPSYSLFFAGNTASNFLYEPFFSKQNIVIPDGPVVRSLGEREGGLEKPANGITGGTSYWHLNLNISVPVPKWARPLIPDVVISEEPRRTTLRSALKGQASTAKNAILDDLIENHGFPDNEQTEEVADRIIDKDIRPTLNYLADRANLYSIKPVLLFDIAGINDRVLKNKTWIAAGIGVQINIVMARFEIGYVHTLSPSSDSGTGNLFLRFILQNFY